MKQKRSHEEETTRLLVDTVRMAHNTNQIGDETMDELQRQGEVLHSSRRNLMTIEDMTTSTHESVRQLKLKMYQRKFMLGAIIVILFLIIMTMLYVMFTNGGSLHSR